MNTIKIIIIVDALGTATSGSLLNNVYLIDTEKYLGSWNEGQCDLHTLTEDGQIIKWAVAAVSSDNQVAITGFSGQIIDQKVCVPSQQGISGDIFWEGMVEAQPGRYSYSVSLSIDGQSFSFDPYLEVQ